MLFLTSGQGLASEFRVVFETTNCSSESGYIMVDVEDIYKIENADCKQLKKMLVKNDQGTYDTFTLTQVEAKRVLIDMKVYMKTQLANLEKTHTLITKK